MNIHRRMSVVPLNGTEPKYGPLDRKYKFDWMGNVYVAFNGDHNYGDEPVGTIMKNGTPIRGLMGRNKLEFTTNLYRYLKGLE